jgi:hypothetical protein
MCFQNNKNYKHCQDVALIVLLINFKFPESKFYFLRVQEIIKTTNDK